MSFEDWAFLLAIAAALLSTASLVISLIRGKEPIRVVLRRWLSRLSDAFWGSG